MKRAPTTILVSLKKKKQQGNGIKRKRAPTIIFVSLTNMGQQGSGIRKNKRKRKSTKEKEGKKKLT